MMRNTPIVIATFLIASSAAADALVSTLALPGDCARASADFETPPLYEQAAGVSGPVSDHFSPNAGGLVDALPVDLTRTRSEALTGVVGSTANLVEDAVDTADGTVSDLGDAIGEIMGMTGSALDETGGNSSFVGSAVGMVGDSTTDAISGTLGGPSGSLDGNGAVTNTLPGTTNTLTGAATSTLTGTTNTLTGTATNTLTGTVTNTVTSTTTSLGGLR